MENEEKWPSCRWCKPSIACLRLKEIPDYYVAFALEASAPVVTSSPQAVSGKLMAGFVECLDNEEAEEGMENEEGKSCTHSNVETNFTSFKIMTFTGL